MSRTTRTVAPEFDPMKATPSGVSDMRFGGGRRPQSMAPEALMEEVRKPVDLRWARYKTEIIFGGIFAMVGVAMVLGAVTVAIPGFYNAKEVPVAQAPAADEADEAPAEEPSGELQGGVKVRKGIKK